LFGGNLERKLGSFGTKKFLAARMMLSELRPPAANFATENIRNCPRLSVARSIVDNYASTGQRLVGPKVSLKVSYYGYTEIIEFDVIEMTFPDMPEKNVFAKVVIWGLCERAGTGNRAAAVVEPITLDAPIGVI
jgi:hypothetical protein